MMKEAHGKEEMDNMYNLMWRIAVNVTTLLLINICLFCLNHLFVCQKRKLVFFKK